MVTLRPKTIKRVSRVPPTTPAQHAPATDTEEDEGHHPSRFRRHSFQTRHASSPMPDAPIRSPPPNTGSKRSRSPDSTDDENTREPKHQSGSHPKQLDYSPEVKEIIAVAIQLWRLKIFCENAFPSVQQETTWICEVWREACTKLKADHPLRSDISRVVSLYINC